MISSPPFHASTKHATQRHFARDFRDFPADPGDGRELIHRRYDSWVRGLVGDIRNALRKGYSNPPPPTPPAVTVMLGPEGKRLGTGTERTALSARSGVAAAPATAPGGG